MRQRLIGKFGGLLLLIGLGMSAGATPSSLPLEKLHQEATVVDTHVDTVLRMLDQGVTLKSGAKGHINLPKMQQGGLDVVFFSIWVDPQYADKAKERADFLIAKVKAEVVANSQQIEMAYSYADIQRIVKARKIAVLLGLEGSHPLENDLQNLDDFYRQGIRYLGLTWSNHTIYAGSSGQGAKNHGLTAAGKKLLMRLVDLGILIDLSHASDQTFWDVLSAVKVPVIASHSSARTLRNHPRNLSDAMLKALAKNGGVAAVNFFPGFLVKDRKATLEDVVDHIEQMIKSAGIGHVGLGSDFDGIKTTPQGLEDSSKYPAITQELRRRGYSDGQIRQILGGNLMRVFAQVLK